MIKEISKGNYLLTVDSSEISWNINLYKGDSDIIGIRHGKLLRYFDFTFLNKRRFGFKY